MLAKQALTDSHGADSRRAHLAQRDHAQHLRRAHEKGARKGEHGIALLHRRAARRVGAVGGVQRDAEARRDGERALRALVNEAVLEPVACRVEALAQQ
jgi:hypothetical protein